MAKHASEWKLINDSSTTVKKPSQKEKQMLVTPICFAIHRPEESPVFGDGIIHVSVDDDGAGPFVVIKQLSWDKPESGVCAFDISELEQITKAARKLIKAQPNNET